MNLSEKVIKNLITAALEARKNSYNPYSKFAVGAAVLTDEVITLFPQPFETHVDK